MKSLIVCAYASSFFAAVSWLLMAFDMFQHTSELNSGNALFFLLLFPPVLQGLYVRKFSAYVNLRVFKTTESLDDYDMNGMKDGDVLITVSPFWKAVNSLNSLLLCGFFIAFTSSVLNVVSIIFSWNFQNAREVALLPLLLLFAVTIPTVIFNLRTFNLERITDVKE